MADKYIEIKGPYQIKDSASAQKIKTEIQRLAKEYPKAKFILREAKRAQGSGSVYSAAFQSLAANKQAKRAHVVKQIFTKSKGVESPSKVREAKIAALKPFKQVEFTFSGEVASPEYQKWRAVDISLSKEQTWDPLRSKGQHFQSFEGYKPHMVPKFKGGKASATKKIDALMDRISEYGRKKGAKRTSVDAGIQYLYDKAGQFEEEQRYYKKKRGPRGDEPINMLTEARIERLERLRKNYGTPPKLTGKVNIISTADKKIKPQVPVSKENIGKHTVNIPKFDRKASISVETTETKHAHHPPGGIKVVKTRHDRLVRTSEVVRVGTDKIKVAKSLSEGKPKPDVPIEKRGQVGTGLIEGGPETSHDPVGIKRRPDSARQFDETAIHSSPENEILYPEQSSDREYFEKDTKKQGKQGNPNVTYDEYPPKKTKVVKKRFVIPQYSAMQSIHAKLTNPKFTQFPDIISGSKKLSAKMKRTLKREYAKRGLRVEKGRAVVHPTSKITSGLAQFDKFDAEKTPEFGQKEAFTAQRDDVGGRSNFEVEIGEDMGGGKKVNINKEGYLEGRQQEMTDELATKEYYDKDKKHQKGSLPRRALENRPWNKYKVGKTTTVSDVIYGDSADYIEEGPHKGRRRASATVGEHVKDAKLPQVYGDPTYQGRKKKLTGEQKSRLKRVENQGAKGDTTWVETKKNQKGKPYQSLIRKYTSDVPIQEQLEQENVYRKKTGGKTQKDLDKAQHAVDRNAALKRQQESGDLKLHSTKPGKDQHGDQKQYKSQTVLTKKTKKRHRLLDRRPVKPGGNVTSRLLLPPAILSGIVAEMFYEGELRAAERQIVKPSSEGGGGKKPPWARKGIPGIDMGVPLTSLGNKKYRKVA